MESINNNREKRRRVFHDEWYIMHLFDTIKCQEDRRYAAEENDATDQRMLSSIL
jgi:hypothetical protein